MENENLNNTEKKSSKSAITASVIGANLLILILYTVYAKTSGAGSDGIILLAFAIAFQVILNLVVGVILLAFKRLSAYGRACLLSAAAVLLIGFSTCFLVSN